MAPRLVTRTLVAALVVALAGCGGAGDGGAEPAAAPEPRGIPVPAEVASTGTVTEPVLEARWLEESTGTAESTDYFNSDVRSGGLVLDDVVVTYGRDIISAVDRVTGKSAWRSDLDMEGQTVCDITEPSSPDVEVLTVVYGEDGYCTRAARIAVDDGHALESYQAGEEEFSVDRFVGLVTHDGTDYVAETYGAISTFGEDQLPREVFRIRGEEDVEEASPVDDPAVLVVLTGSLLRGNEQVLHGISLTDMEELWKRPTRDVLPARIARAGIQLHPTDGRFLMAQTGSTHHLVKIDPETGDRVGTLSRDDAATLEAGDDMLFVDLDNQDNAPETFGRVGEDVVLNNTARGLARVGMDGEVKWRFLPEMTLREGDDAFVNAGPVTDDGRQMLATLTNGRSADLLLLDTEDGSLLGRWAVPEEYVAGFAARPYVRLVGDEGVLLVRNLTLYGDTETFEDGVDDRTPFDSGYFTFPES